MSETFAVPGSITPILANQIQPPAPPPLWAVILINDDITPAEFVVELLIQIFGKTAFEAVDIMLKVHTEGRAVAGVYSHQIAETQVYQVRGTSSSHRHPLQCTMEVA